jgi:hypothetical protein
VFIDLMEHDIVILEDLLPLDLRRRRLGKRRRLKENGDEDRYQ